MATQIQIKRGLSTAFGPITLLSGEPAFLTDTGKFYVGNGTDKVLINPIEKPIGLNTADFYTKVKVNEFGQIVTQQSLVASDIPAIPSTSVTGLGTAALSNIGTAIGNVPVLGANGKLDVSTLPSIAITDTFVVASEIAMLALTAEVGDVAVRTDTNRSFILQKSPATALANWVELLQPTDAVLSVNGKVGAVVLAPVDFLMTGYAKASAYSPIATTDNLLVAVGKLEKNFDSFAKLDSPTFAGTPTAPTVTAGDSTQKIATTAFVTMAVAPLAPNNSPNFVGTPTAPTVVASDNSTKIATTAFVKSAVSSSVAVIDGGNF
ncbi:MAG: hypothetical protein RSA24_04705 [Clostridia bacterium]